MRKKATFIPKILGQIVFLSLRHDGNDFLDRSFFLKRLFHIYTRPKKNGRKSIADFFGTSSFEKGAFLFSAIVPLLLLPLPLQ